MTGLRAAAPALLAISHGTSSADGAAAIEGLVSAVAAARPELEVHAGFVDVQQPSLPDVLGRLAPDRAAVVVPLLLSAGFHVHVDIANDIAAVGGSVIAARALGPDARIIDVLERRVVATMPRPDDRLVLIAAGSSDERAVEDCRRTARMLAARLAREVEVGFVSAASPAAPDAVSLARVGSGGARVIAVNYMLAPGYFSDLAARSGADVTTAPLLEAGRAPARELVELVVDRYDAAVGEALALANASRVLIGA